MKYIDVYININNRIGSGRGVADCRDIESHIYVRSRGRCYHITYRCNGSLEKKGSSLDNLKVISKSSQTLSP